MKKRKAERVSVWVVMRNESSGVKHESSRGPTVTFKSCIDDTMITLSATFRKRNHQIEKERARRNTQTAGKKRRNARQAIPCSGEKEERPYENTNATVTTCPEPLPRRPPLPLSRRILPRRTNLLSPEEGTVNKKGHGETHKLQTERDEMQGRKQPAVGKRRKYYHVHSFLAVARTPTPPYTCKTYQTCPRHSSLLSTTAYLLRYYVSADNGKFDLPDNESSNIEE
jgi:hypothetical protein